MSYQWNHSGQQDFNTHKTCWKFCINNERPTGQKQQLLDGRTVENKGKLIPIINSEVQHDIKKGGRIFYISMFWLWRHKRIIMFIFIVKKCSRKYSKIYLHIFLTIPLAMCSMCLIINEESMSSIPGTLFWKFLKVD